jgi:hypothetical protein
MSSDKHNGIAVTLARRELINAGLQGVGKEQCHSELSGDQHGQNPT